MKQRTGEPACGAGELPAAAVIGSRWIWHESGDEGILRRDLGQVADALAADPRKKNEAANAARTLAILHSTGKSNEQFAKGVNRPPKTTGDTRCERSPPSCARSGARATA